MKRSFLLLSFLSLLSACTPEDDDLAKKVEGIYATTSITTNGKAIVLPQGEDRKSIALQATDATHVKVLAEMDSLSGIPSFETTAKLSSGGQGITLIMEDENVATIHQGKMRMYFIKRDNTLVQIDAVLE